MKRFDGKVVVITGASSGIGAASAVGFSEEGAKVVLVGRNKDRLKETEDACKKANAQAVLVLQVDLMNFDELKSIVCKTVEKFGQIDVLVNNAGLAKGTLTGEITLEHYDIQMNTNIRAPVFITQQALPYLEKTEGCIINVSSIAGLVALPQVPMVYSMTKAAIDHFCRSLSSACAPKGIRVNNVNPAAVETRFLDELIPDSAVRKETLRNKYKVQPLGLIQPEDVAKTIVFLASSDASYITGVTLPIDAGAAHHRPSMLSA